MSMLLLTPLFFPVQVTPEADANQPEAAVTLDATLEATVRHLLDSDADGTVDRYEAAAAAMAWVDATRAREEAGTTPGPVSADALLSYLGSACSELQAKAERKADSPGESEGARWKEANLEAESKAWFERLNVNADGVLDAGELDEAFPRNSWRIFDTSNDQRLELVEFTPLAAASHLPASFTVEGPTATMSGAITASTPGRFLRLLLEHRDVNELVLAFVPSSSNDEASSTLLSLANQSGVTIRVPRGGSTAPAGSELLLAGERRMVEQGALVGTLSAAGDVHYMTEDEIHENGVRTENQGLEVFQTGTRSSLRGLCGVTNEIAWATGSGATVLRTTDAGRSWANLAPASIAGLDVRDVFAISADVCWIMTAGPGESSRILFTENGGGTWVEQYRETSPQAFLDGLDAWDAGTLIAYGDPMEDGRFRVLLTEDGGQTWIPSTTGPLALESGEASFAASGTGVRTLGGLRAWIVTGGTKDKARVFWSEDTGQTWTPAATPVEAKGAGAGAFSVAFREDGTGVIVGGDFLAREVGGTANAAWSTDFGKTWQPSVEGPRGQRAGSVALGNGWFLATGQTGTDVSRDGGKTWRAFSSEGFHCVDTALQDGTIWLAGPRGRVGRVR